MNGAEHRRQAERILDGIHALEGSQDPNGAAMVQLPGLDVDQTIAVAHVHALLADRD